MNYTPNPRSLTSARESRALTIDDAAGLARISADRLRDLEGGKPAKGGELKKLAEVRGSARSIFYQQANACRSPSGFSYPQQYACEDK